MNETTTMTSPTRGRGVARLAGVGLTGGASALGRGGRRLPPGSRSVATSLDGRV